MARHRVLVIGLDGVSPTVFERFLKQDQLPNLKRLYRRGSYSKVLPVIPAQTPANWTTVATGANPGTHGVFLWGTHRTGEPPMEFHDVEAFASGMCKAEYLWETAARHGLNSVVINFTGYPPTTEKAVFIDWLYHPNRYFFEIAGMTCYTNMPSLDNATRVALRPADDWVNLPESHAPHLAADIPFEGHDNATAPSWYLLTWASGANGYDRMCICTRKDGGDTVAVLRESEWSGWLTAPFTVKGETVTGSMRFKLVKLSPNASSFVLYRSQVYPTDGRFAHPPEWGRKLVERFGPYLNEGVARAFIRGWIDEKTMQEELRYQIHWLANAVHATMVETDASLLMMHWHHMDRILHVFTGRLDPEGYEYDPDKVDNNWSIVGRALSLADELVGAIVSRFGLDETTVFVVSDHGMPPNRRGVSLFNLFRKHGLIRTKQVNGKEVPDWDKSLVYYQQNMAWVNLKGREPNGTVDKADFAAVRAKIVQLLRDLKDPETGQHAMCLVLTKEQAPMIGYWGPDIGDVIFVYEGGFRWSGPEVLELGEDNVFFPSGGANHGPQPPTYETEVSSNYGICLAAGPGIRQGYHRSVEHEGPVAMVDIAPTVSHILGISVPAQCEGKVIKEFFQQIPKPERVFRPFRRNFKMPRLRAALQGDATDVAI